jgi:hypothetical protein
VKAATFQDEWALHKLQKAKHESELAFARVRGMKNRAAITPATAATGGFPYPARTCAQLQWRFRDHSPKGRQTKAAARLKASKG